MEEEHLDEYEDDHDHVHHVPLILSNVSYVYKEGVEHGDTVPFEWIVKSVRENRGKIYMEHGINYPPDLHVYDIIINNLTKRPFTCRINI